MDKRTAQMRNRVTAGVCPCCRKPFKYVAAHVKNKHPEFNGKVACSGSKLWVPE